MLGKHHVEVSLSSGLTFLSICGAMLPIQSNPNKWTPVDLSLSGLVDVFFPSYINRHSFMMSVLWLLLLIVSYVFGILLPDIDSPSSMLGRYVHLPFDHRTWTHSLFLYLFLVPAAILFKPAMMVLLGVLMHLFEDASSAQGVCFFYPLEKYREYPSGAKVKKKHKVKLYHAGKPSENWLVGFCVGLSIGLTVWTGFFEHGFYNLWIAFKQ